MPDEPQTQQAPVEEATQGTPPEGQAQEVATEDWKARYEQLEQQHKRDEQRYRSMEGNMVKAAERDALMLSMNSQISAMMDHLSDPDADPLTLAKKRQELQSRSQEELAQARNAQVKEGLLAGILEIANQADLDLQDPKLANALNAWREGTAESDTRKMTQAYREVVRVSAEAMQGKTKAEIAAAKKEAEDARKRFNADNGALNANVGGGAHSPATRSLEALSKIDLRRFTPKELAEFNKEYNEAMRLAR